MNFPGRFRHGTAQSPHALSSHNILTGKPPAGKLEGGILCNGHVCVYGPVHAHALEGDCTGDPECMLLLLLLLL